MCPGRWCTLFFLISWMVFSFLHFKCITYMKEMAICQVPWYLREGLWIYFSLGILGLHIRNANNAYKIQICKLSILKWKAHFETILLLHPLLVYYVGCTQILKIWCSGCLLTCIYECLLFTEMLVNPVQI